MPAAGTRKATINGRECYLPEQDARIEKLLQDGCALQARIAADKDKLGEIKAELVGLAEEHRGAGGTVHLEGHGGQRAQVVFAKAHVVDPAKARALQGPLGKLFSNVFNARVEFSLAKGYRTFMETSALSDAIKLKIGKAISVREHKPRVTLFDVV